MAPVAPKIAAEHVTQPPRAAAHYYDFQATRWGRLDRTSVASTIQRLAQQHNSPETLRTLVRRGIINFRSAQQVDLQHISHTDLSLTITERRLALALSEINKERVQIHGNPSALGRVGATTMDCLWSIRTTLRKPEKLDELVNDPMLTAGAKVKKQTKLGLALAFLSGTLTACSANAITVGSVVGSIAAVIGTMPPALLAAGLGILGASIYLYVTRPQFKDAVNRSVLPLSLMSGGLAVRFLAASGAVGFLPGLGLYLATMVVPLAARGLWRHFVSTGTAPYGVDGGEKGRLRALLNDPNVRPHVLRRDVSFSILPLLADVKWGRYDSKLWTECKNRDIARPTLNHVLEEVDGRLREVKKPEDREALQEVRDLIAKCDNAEKAYQELNDYMAEHIRRIPDIKVPNQFLIAESKLSRMFNMFYLVPLTLCWASSGFSMLNALIFGTLYLSQIYYTLGAVWYNKLTETAEYVEPTRFPDFQKDDNGESKPVVMTVRYSNKGVMDRKGSIPTYMKADIFNRVLYGENYYVVFNNDSHNHYFFNVYGSTRIAQLIEGRMHCLINGIFPQIAEIASKSPLEQGKLAFALSCKEFDVDPLRMLDHAVNKVYPDGPADGASIRFRDGHSFVQRISGQAIGDGRGEIACYDALHRLVIQSESLSGYAKNVAERALKRLIIGENGLDLLSIHESEAVAALCDHIRDRFGIDQRERDALFEAIESRKEEYLWDVLQAKARTAGIDQYRAAAIAHGIIERTKAGLGFDKIAANADKLMLGLPLSQEESATLRGSLAKTFELSEATVNELVDHLQTLPVEEGARKIAGLPNVPRNIFWRLYRYTQLALAYERTGVKSEEGNLRRVWEYLKTTRGLTPEQTAYKIFLIKLAGGADKVDALVNKLGGSNAHTGILIARRIQAQLINQGWLKGGFERTRRKNTEDLSRTIAIEIAKELAQVQPTPADFEAAAFANPDSAHKAVFDEFLGKFDGLVRTVVERLLSDNRISLPGKLVEQMIEMAADAAKEEFACNHNEVFRTTVGLAEILTHELAGLGAVQAALASDTVFKTRLDTRLSDARNKKAEARLILRRILDVPENELDEVLKTTNDTIKGLLDKGLGSFSANKGSLLLFSELLERVPQVIEGSDDLTIDRGAETYVIADRKDQGKTRKALRVSSSQHQELIAALRLMTESQIESRKVTAEAELWVSSVTTGYREKWGYERPVMEPTSVPIAAFIVEELMKNNLNPDLTAGENPIKIVNQLVEQSTIRGLHDTKKINPARDPLKEERKAILTEIWDTITRGQVTSDDFAMNPKFDSVYRFSRVWGFRWGVGKPENTNREFLGSRVNEMVGTMFRYLINVHFAERAGFYRVPIHVTQRIKVEVTSQLMFAAETTTDFNEKLQRGLMPEDIAHRLVAALSSGVSSSKAAEQIWDEIWKDMTPEQKRQAIRATRSGKRVAYLSDIRKNLEDIASEIALLYYSGQMMDHFIRPEGEGHAQDVEAAREYISGLDHLTFLEKEALRKRLRSERIRLGYNQRQVIAYQKAVKEQKVMDAIEIERMINYKGKADTFKAQYRHGDKLPEYIIGGRARSFAELAAWLSSMQMASERAVENGELKEDAVMLRRIAEVADEVLREIDTTEGDHQQAGARLLKTFTREDGKRIEERIDRFTQVLAWKLQEREEADKAKGKLNPIENCLDERRYRKTAIEEVRASVQMNADTDNIFYPELLKTASHFGYLWGAFAQPNEVIQYGLNYSVDFRSPFGRFQRDRDLGGPQNCGDARTQGAPFGAVRNRYRRLEFAATLTGYANLLPVSVAFQTTENELVVNLARSSYHGQRALEHILGNNWWDIKNEIGPSFTLKGGRPITRWENMRRRDIFTYNGLKARILNYVDLDTSAHRWYQFPRFALFLNQLSRSATFGKKENAWDLMMSLSHWPVFLFAIPALSWGIGHGVNAAMDALLGGGSEFLVSGSLLELSAYSGAAFLALKVAARAFGSRLALNQMFRSRRVYLLHPSEDLGTTYSQVIKGVTLTSCKGLRQQNAPMIEYEGDLGQKLRWQAMNANLLWMAAKKCWNYRAVMPGKQMYDLLQGPIYNMFGIPGMFNRLSLLGFIFFAEPSILMLDQDLYRLPVQNSLEWLVETGFINYLLVELVLRHSRINGGSSWKGVSSNMGYETALLGYNYNYIMRRFFHREMAGWNVTDPPNEPCQIKLTGRKGMVGPFFQQNYFLMGAEAYALYRLFFRHISDGVAYLDFMELFMASLVPWVALKFYYNIKGHKLNSGISTVEDEAKWEKKHKVWEQ
ncbi:MAG: hypothetical protein WC645_06685 [Candidatus Margulisiibacteriota bacterium]